MCSLLRGDVALLQEVTMRDPRVPGQESRLAAPNPVADYGRPRLERSVVNSRGEAQTRRANRGGPVLAHFEGASHDWHRVQPRPTAGLEGLVCPEQPIQTE